MGANAKPSTHDWCGWQSVRPVSVSSRIVDQIRAALFRGEFRSGDFVGSEGDLARKLGVSRVPVRDAFKTLQAMGIVEVRTGANGGARIAAGDPSRFADALAVQFKLVGIGIDEMFDAQIATEVMAAELASARSTPDDLLKMRAIIISLESIAARPMTAASGLKFTQAGMDFHEALVEAAHNRALSAQFKALRYVLEPVYARHSSNAIARRVIAAHRAVADAVERRDTDRVCALVRRRLEVIRASKHGWPAASDSP